MFKQLRDYFLAPYDEASHLIKVKSNVLLIGNLIVLLVLVSSIVFVELLVVRRLSSLLLDLAWIVVIAFSLLLLRKGQREAATAIIVVFNSIGVTAQGYMSVQGPALFIFVKVAFLMTPVIVFACLVCTSLRAPILATIYSLLVVVLYFFHFMPEKLGTPFTAFHYSWLFNAMVLLGTIGVMATITTFIYVKAIARAEEETAAKTRHLAELRYAEARFRAIFDSVEEAIFIHDSSTGRVLDVNQKMTEMYGYTREEALDLRINDLSEGVSPYSQREALEKIQNASLDTSQVFEWRAKHKDGTLFWIEIILRKALINNEMIVLVSAREISDRKKAEEQQRLLEERLRQSEKMEAIGQLAGGVAHDFNNQLTGILGHAEMLSQICSDPEAKATIESIRKSALRSADLTQQLLAFARKGNVMNIVVDVRGLLDEVITLLAHSIDKRIAIEREFEGNPTLVTGDPSQLQNAFLNLALNARDAMPTGGILRFACHLTEINKKSARGFPIELPPGMYVVIQISDTGVGMDEGVQKRIYEPFFTTKGQGKGTGLGLAAVYGTVQSHKGYIFCDSQPGKGTCFRLFLPADKPSLLPENHPDAPVKSGRKLRILVIDDEEMVRVLMQNMLEFLGHHVSIEPNGQVGIATYRTHWSSTDLVLLDMLMPDLGGHDVFNALRAINPEVKVLLSSGFSLDNETQAMLNDGAVGFLQKPFTLEELQHQLAVL